MHVCLAYDTFKYLVTPYYLGVPSYIYNILSRRIFLVFHKTDNMNRAYDTFKHLNSVLSTSSFIHKIKKEIFL